jgi:hypothetical protein
VGSAAPAEPAPAEEASASGADAISSQVLPLDAALRAAEKVALERA